MPRASWESLAGMPFLVPPLHEQQAIAAFLDRETARIDALIEKKRRQIELLKEKRQAITTRAVTKGLDPDAPITVDPFMPAVMGTKQIANFTTTSMPALGSLWLVAFAAGIVAIALWNLRIVMREPRQTERVEGNRL